MQAPPRIAPNRVRRGAVPDADVLLRTPTLAPCAGDGRGRLRTRPSHRTRFKPDWGLRECRAVDAGGYDRLLDMLLYRLLIAVPSCCMPMMQARAMNVISSAYRRDPAPRHHGQTEQAVSSLCILTKKRPWRGTERRPVETRIEQGASQG